MVKRRGFVLVDILVALTFLALLLLGATLLLRMQGQQVRELYEEKLAWEAACSVLELLEADEFLTLKTGEVDPGTPGWENLARRKCRIQLEDGFVIVKASWRDARGFDRSVEARTWKGAGP